MRGEHFRIRAPDTEHVGVQCPTLTLSFFLILEFAIYEPAHTISVDVCLFVACCLSERTMRPLIGISSRSLSCRRVVPFSRAPPAPPPATMA